ncbi:hypothetical protein F0562_021879 [Nyssa sinensis]|uniref:Uncharacterized protein n=1 Tax=Nyssa sinensis TaxID=561372 RepID=A0A5J5BMP6_9ASTE|nr:hypothetical protein F0562_021879 [Nyssa sinensis]
MEEMASLWSYQESMDEMKQKLLYTTLELESVKQEAREEMGKNKEYVKHLFQLLKTACQERDEARNQLQKLLNKVISSPVTSEFFTALPQIQPESPLVKPTKANSSITESNSLSYHSHGSSPADSFFDATSSPELSNINMGDSSNLAFVNQPFVHDYNGTIVKPKIDQASVVIDNLVKGKTLPQKGKLLQSVLEAGPLLQTLLVAGPLPRWRNPPPLQPFQIPPVSIKGCDAEFVTRKPAANPSHVVPKSLNSPSYVEMSCGSSQMLSSSMLNFGSGSSVSCLGNARLISTGANTNSFIPSGKRQRFQ